jgi:hypothetical protein
LTAGNGNNLYTAAYNSAGFVPSNPNTNFLADAGSSGTTQTYSFTAPAGQPFTVVVHDLNVTPASNSPYALNVSLSNCSAGPSCTPVSVTTASIASGTTGALYSQSFAASGGSGTYNFSLAGTLPAGLSFSGNTISGTPTQAGSFPITVTATDVAGCPPGSQSYTLVVTGNVPASITATAGSGQSVVPGTPFPTQLQATVRDASNNPLGGVGVTFTAPGSGASGTFAGSGTTASVVTNASGVATAPVFTANATTGSYTVTATVVGLPVANFSLSNTCPGSFVVSSNADSGPGTLREILGNVCTGSTVTFAPGIGNTIVLTSGQIPVNKSITINGPGANNLAISGNHLSRIFSVSPGAGNSVSISGLTIKDCQPSGDSNGGGGILLLSGNFILTDSVVSNNDASAAGNPLGGGIDNEGAVVTITRSAIVNNVATFRGGGIQNQNVGSMTISDSTIAGNTAGTAGIGGGIRSLLPLTLTNCTIFGNSAQTAGNVSRSGNTITFKNTIIAGGVLIGSGGTSPDINGAGFNSADYNLIQNTTGGTITGTTTNNITGASPNLLPLGNYGGPSLSLLPAPNSPVINAGDPALASGTEQRGLTRIVGGRADIGAVETNYALSASGGTPQSAYINSVFGSPMQATVSESGNGVSGVTVTFTAPGAGASGLFVASTTTTASTNGSGVATASTFTANGTTGVYNVTGGIGSIVPTVNFALTNLAPPQFFVNDSSVVKPATGTTTMIFTVTLAQPAASTVTVNYATAHDNLGTHPATDNVDYDATSGTLTFNTGEQFKTVSVTVHANAAVSVDQTFLVNLSSPSAGTLVRPQAVGTIKANRTPSITLISELRSSGPAGPGDDFVELYNNTNSPLTVAASDASAGWGLFKMGATCADAPVLIATIPNGTVIPANGHFLLAGSQYSLAGYPGGAADQTLLSDIENDANLALFTTSNLGSLSSSNRLDAVGFGSNTTGICALLGEGNTLLPALGSTSQYSFLRKLTNVLPQDTDDNASDLMVVSTTPAAAVGSNASPTLGAPGPQNLAAPRSFGGLTPGLIDPNVSATLSPNRVRNTASYTDTLSGTGTYSLGTLAVRRQYTNNTGTPVTRLRFRLIDVTTGPAPAGTADLRAVTAQPTQTVTTSVGSVTVNGTALETPPLQPNGGGINSTVSVNLPTPLANGQSIAVEWLMGVKQGGTFRFYVDIEALP